MVKCEVCSISDHKYRCPKCLIRYCSLACYKKHQVQSCDNKASRNDKSETNPGEGKTPLQAIKDELGELQSEDKIPFHKLEMLKENRELRVCLENPHVRQILLDIDSSTDPSNLLKSAMSKPIFEEFADHCLKIVEDA